MLKPENIKVFYSVFFISAILTIAACEYPKKETAKPTVIKRKSVDSLTQGEIWERYLNNPCYLPLLRDSAYWEQGTPIGFSYQDLFNDSIGATHKYGNRYLVGDFNALNPDYTNRTVSEIFPYLPDLKDFEGLPRELAQAMNQVQPRTSQYDSLIISLRQKLGTKAEHYINFLEKVWKYKLIPVKREYSIQGDSLYSAGHYIVVCEACGDTLIMQARFATSPKSKDVALVRSETGRSSISYFSYLPIGSRRRYYAGMNRITSKNWERAREYDSLDIARDNEVGGGNNRVTIFTGGVELPNFLLIQPSAEYPRSVKQNGIHEVALRFLPQAMLGTPNSLGCLRVSDFASKFLRWWTPQNAKLFIAYKEDLYHRQIPVKDTILHYLPFKSQAEGDRFRQWLRQNKPAEASLLDIDEDGSYTSGHLIDAYYYLKEEYNQYLNTQKFKKE
jgi:hypothetical protein